MPNPSARPYGELVSELNTDFEAMLARFAARHGIALDMGALHQCSIPFQQTLEETLWFALDRWPDDLETVSTDTLTQKESQEARERA